MKKIPALFLAGLAFPVLAAAASAQAQVVSRTPYGQAPGPSVPAVTATFDRPMAALSSAENMAASCPLELLEIGDELTPANYRGYASARLGDFKDIRKVEGRCRWQGTQTLAFEPAAPLKQATLYAARVNKFSGAGQALREENVWFFETMRPAINESAPDNDQRWLPLDTLAFAAFNMPVTSARARAFVKMFDIAPGGAAAETPAGVRPATAEEIKKLWPYPWQNVSTGTVLAVRPAMPLKPDHAYIIRFGAGLPAAAGNLGLTADREIKFETYYTFALKKEPDGGCLPHSFLLGFSNPVRYSELFAKMKVAGPTGLPKLGEEKSLREGWRRPDERIAYSELPYEMFKPAAPYTLTLPADLTDVFGNRLGAERKVSFATGDYCPYLSMPSGFGILEGYLPARHPVEAVNSGEVSVVKARVPEENLVPFYLGRMGASGLLAGRLTKKWNPSPEKPNQRLRTFLDFAGVFGEGEGGFGYLEAPTLRGGIYQALDNITRVGLTVKSSPDSTLVFASFLKTGKPAAGLPVEIRTDANKVVWTGLTGKDGFADAPGWQRLGVTDWKRWERPSLWVFARHKNGTAVMNTAWTGGVEPWRFGVNYDHYPRPRRYSAALFTERGVYRPGETVDMKAIGRKLSGGDWAALDIPVAQLAVVDSRGNRVLKATVPVNADFSSLDYAYRLSESAPTGVWTIELTEPFEDDESTVRAAEGDETEGDGDGEYREDNGKERPFHFTETFRVEEFKPAVFEVKSRAIGGTFLAGGKFSAAVEGWYLFGAPMSGAPADWTLRLTDAYYAPPGHDGFSFGREYGYNRYDRLAGSGGLKLDEKGKGLVEVQLDKADGSGGNALRASFEAGVTDPERQRLFGRASAYVHKADLYYGVKASGGFTEAGKPWSASVIAVRPGGEPAGLGGEVKLVKRQWLSSRRAGLGGRLEWVSETKDTVVSSAAFSGGESPYVWNYTPDGGGFYIFSASGKDEQGRATETSFSFYVFGKGDAWWAREDSDIIELVAEKYDYKPGETARIMVKSPYAEAVALVTVEREGVLDRWVTTTRGGADFINVPIKEKYLPNAYVSVILLKGRAADQKYSEDGDDMSKPQAKFGYAAFSVSPAGRRLAVALKADKADYRPGQEVKLDIAASDEAGAPAPAELTVFAVDEGVLSLTGYATPDVFGAFYGARPLNVLTADSRLHVIGQRSYGEKGEARGGGGGASLAGIDLRSNFIPTAYWNPSVKTGPDGKASVSFKLPDSLTRFRLMAVANTGARFGSGDTAVTVSKPLMLRPSLPRLARAGDRFSCGVVVHNYSKELSTVTVSAEAAGDAITVRGEPRREAAVEAGKAAELMWDCTAEKPGETVFRFRAAAGAETDGLEWKVPVKTWEPREYAATSGVSSALAEESLRRPYPGAEGDLGVEVSPSAMAGLNEGVRYLLEYPYGCLEQRLSRAMPVVTGGELVETFALGGLGTLKAETRKVFDKLGDYQHPAGGFCYWTGGCWKPDPYLTAYALESAALAAKEGYRSDPDVVKRAADWMETYLGTEQTDWAYPYSRSEDYAARAYAIYALALNGRNMSGYFGQLYLKRDQVPYLARAYMVKAAPLLGFDPVSSQKLAAEIMTQARYSPTLMHFEDAEPMPWIHNSAVQTTAVMLDAMLEARGGFAGDEKAVKWLTGERKARGRWRTTQENAWTLRALQGFYRRYEKDVPDFRAVVSIEGDKVVPVMDEQFQVRTMSVRAGSSGFGDVFGSSDTAKVLFSKAGTGRLYYTLRMGFVPAKRDKPAAEGLEISRTMKPLDGGTVFRAGARAVVTVTVKTPQDRTFVAVNDPVPAGFEIVNTEFATESSENARTLEQQGGRGGDWGGFERAERYDDRMLIFADYLAAGEHKYSYVVQATVPGVFYAPSSLAEGMYEPEVFGRTAGSTVEIK